MESLNAHFTQDELAAAFDKVANPDDWRAEIFALVDLHALAVTVEAIRHFTATQPTIAVSHTDPNLFSVTSIGYRLGPAGP